MANRNLVIAATGNKSGLFKTEWLKEKDKKDFDLCIIFFHEEVDDPGRYEDAEYFFHLKGFKYSMISELLTKLRPDFLDMYDYFYFPDDDISIDTVNINRMFGLTKGFGASITQASLSHDSYISWKLLRHRKDCFARYVGQIEVMAPLFSRDALEKCLPSFTVNKSTWGIDSAWPKILGYPEDQLIVFDDIQMIHTRPIGGGELYTKIQSDPHADWDAVAKQYGARKDNFIEYSRLVKVSDRHSPLLRTGVKIGARLEKIQRAINDYGFMWRVRNKLGMKQPGQ